MCNNGNGLCGTCGNGIWWIIILILLFSCCGNQASGCGCDNTCC